MDAMPLNQAGGQGRETQPALLFPDLQPWAQEPQPALDERRKAERDAILRRLATFAESDLGEKQERLAFILRQYPETRDDRRLLVLKYWERFNAKELAQWRSDSHRTLDVLLDLDNFSTLERLARHIQNTLGLFAGDERLRDLRAAMQGEFGRYLAAQPRDCEEIRLYLDETGTDGQSGVLGVAGVCVPDYRFFAQYHAAILQRRSSIGYSGTLHASEITDDCAPHVALMEELKKWRGGLLFIGHAISARVTTHQALLSLLHHLPLDALHRLREDGCLSGPKALVIVKEADEGFDRMYLPSLRTTLPEAMFNGFGGQVYLKEIQSLPKGSEPLLEAADIIAFAMQRGRHPGSHRAKDRLADIVMNVSGLDDPRDRGVVFKKW